MRDGPFTLSLEQLRARESYKWRRYPDGVIAACVADMDFGTAPAVEAALSDALRRKDFIYPLHAGASADRAVAEAFSRRMRVLHDWDVEPARTLVVADLVQAVLACVLAYSEPGDGVIVQVPCYAPFRNAVEETGRRLIALDMVSGPHGHRFDLDALADSIDGRTRVLILCNPHNPTGRVFDHAELASLLVLAERHDLVVVSDEIHADLVYPGARHLPFATLPGASTRTVTLDAATKSFNIAGLRCAVAHFGAPALQRRFHARIPLRLTGAVNNFGIDATVAAWDQGGTWLTALREHLLAMRDHLVGTLRRELPALRCHVPEATYLLWIDCAALGLHCPAGAFFLEHAGVALSPGEVFDPRAAQCVRLNFATSRQILDALLERMIAAVRAHAPHD